MVAATQHIVELSHELAEMLGSPLSVNALKSQPDFQGNGCNGCNCSDYFCGCYGSEWDEVDEIIGEDTL